MPPFCDKHQCYHVRNIGVGPLLPPMVCSACEAERQIAAMTGPQSSYLFDTTPHRCVECDNVRVLIAALLGYDVQQARILDPVAMVKAHLAGEPPVPAGTGHRPAVGDVNGSFV